MDCLLCGLPVNDTDDAYRYRAFKGGASSNDEVADFGTAEHVACVGAGRKGQRIRIYANGPNFAYATVRVIQPDGSEISLDPCVRAVTIRVEDGELNVATVVFEGVEFDVNGYVAPESESITAPA